MLSLFIVKCNPMEESDKVKIVRAHKGGQSRFVRSNVDVCFFGGVLGGGKLISVDEQVLTPKGWVKNGTLKKGDIICTPFGKPTKIVEVFPHKNKDIYIFRTTDGRECQAGLEHLWEVRTRKQLHKYRQHHENKNFMVLTTKEIMDGMAEGKKYFLPIPKAQEFEEKDYLIHPYVMGVLLGDGCISKGCLKGSFISISNPEIDIVNKVAELTHCTNVKRYDELRNQFYIDDVYEYQQYLIDNRLNTTSQYKYIPQEYLWGSIEQRRQLLYGLLDTDGSVGSKNRYSFSTTSERLKDDFIYLCRSLGYIATYNVDKRDKYNSGCAYDICIQTDDIIFTSKKHLERYYKNKKWIEENGFYKRTYDHVRVESIKYKCNEDALCILVEDKDHLYIAGDFMTTHNTFGAVMYMAEHALDSRFRGCFIRRTLGDLKVAGGVVEKFQEVYGDNITVKISENPLIRFKNSGAEVECRQIQNEDMKRVTETWKGSEYDVIAFEELTGFEWTTFKYLLTRNRGKAKNTGHIIATTNPKHNHWVRKFIDGYIKDSHIDPDMDGVVRYFYVAGETVDDVVWGDSKEQVYERCKEQIDRNVRAAKSKDVTYKNFIKSFCFYLGKTSENTTMLKNNPDYFGSIAAAGAKQTAIFIDGNWDIDEDEDEENIPIHHEWAKACLVNDGCTNGDLWVTADLADVGKDNCVFLAWNGFHIFGIEVISNQTTPFENAQRLQLFAADHNVPDSHIIYDGTRALYISDYIPDAIPFISSYSPRGIFRNNARYLKDECYLRLTYVIKNAMLSFDPEIVNKLYNHQHINSLLTVGEEFIDECNVVRFEKMPNGKMKLENKKAMNQRLGRGRSMDLLDPMAMRMYNILEYQVGDELEKTSINYHEPEDEAYGDDGGFDIYDDSNWC